jgi:nitroreductase
MELMDAIKMRRAVRDYADAPVQRSMVEKFIDAAILAPSAMNLQPWAFAVLLDRERIDRYAERVKSWLLEQGPENGLGAAAREILERPGFAVFYHAPALVLVLATSSGTQASEDCCVAAQNLMLAARAAGVGTCWIGFARPWLNLLATKRELGVPEEYQVVAPIILGFPKEWPEPHGRTPAKIQWLA